ncbi:hypothetical protein [Sutterella sp.]|uniref:hypothetical protein n=1 Tax=Sutterella sp. TaxID=1981025 RepID=UPI0026DF2EAC|nr:hypothetical protein [Sutterella sp.]MDO5532092.1 hypothetical protein [Sutterella sp.]
MSEKKLNQKIKELRAEAQSLRMQLEGLETAKDRLERENEELFTANVHLDERIEELEDANSHLVWQIDRAARDDGAAGPGAGAGIAEDLNPALVMRFFGGQKTPNVTMCLRIVRSLLPDRIEIADSAWRSAKELDADFQNHRILLNLLSRLAIDYLDRIRSGQDPHGVFTSAEYAAHESDTTMSTAKLQQQRIFVWKGRSRPMEKHLKIGVDNNSKHMLRLYFEVLPGESRILIGYCGRHLGISGV